MRDRSFGAAIAVCELNRSPDDRKFVLMATFASIKAAAEASGKEIDDVTICFTMGFVAGQEAAAAASAKV